MIDILLASYNGEKYIAEQIESILNQTYKNFRMLIRDDGSTDQTVQIIEKYKIKYPDKITLIQDNVKCGSAVKNFMQLIHYSSSEYVMFSDQDDFWLPDKIQVSLEAMQYCEKNNSKDTPVLVYSRCRIVDENLKEIAHSKKKLSVDKNNITLNQLIVENYVTGCLVMINQSLCRIIGTYDEAILMHDWWMALIASAMGKLVHINQITTLYRQHGDNAVGSTDMRSWKYRIHKIHDKKTRNIEKQYYDQMKLFYDRYKTIMPGESKEIVSDYLEIYNMKPKLKRIKMLIKGGYLKSDFIRQLGQFRFI